MHSARCHNTSEEMRKFVVIQTVKSDFSSQSAELNWQKKKKKTDQRHRQHCRLKFGYFSLCTWSQRPEGAVLESASPKVGPVLQRTREWSCQTPLGSRAGTGRQPQPQEPFPGQAGREAQQLHFGKSHQAQVEVTT